MNVLIADKFEPEGLDALRALGLSVTYQPDLKDAALAEALSTTGPTSWSSGPPR